MQKNTPFPQHKILIIGPAWVGDLVMAQSLFKLIKHENAFTIIHVAVAPHLISLVQRMPEVEKILILPFKHGEFKLLDRIAYAKTLRQEHYDQAIVLPNSWKSALIPLVAKIPKRTGWCGEMRYLLLNDIRRLNRKKIPLMVNRFVVLGMRKNEPIGDKNFFTPQLETTAEFIEKTLTKLHLEKPSKPVLALCVGAEYGKSKCWPSDYFAKIAQVKVKEGWDVWLLGGSKDQPIAEKVQKESGNVCVDLSGKTTLGEVVDLLSLVNFIITNDTGLMHIAAALEKPLLAIYGSSSPSFTPPLSDKARTISLNLECSPCFERECPNGTYKCMRNLTPEMVMEFLQWKTQ